MSGGRGTHDSRPNKILDTTKELVKKHIKSFPLQENHYSRHDSKKASLSADLSVGKMCQLFNEKDPDVKCGLHYYRDIVNTNFNLRFSLPRSDTCEIYDGLFMKMKSMNDPIMLRQLEAESKIHHARADSAYLITLRRPKDS